ncbi:AAA family ATPase [Microgenomates group bacterium RIFCSPLOWO2_01_FULL_46_13]|nr:MAG: AAA family ATPase [Microgenomates group bacterium RIFCSPHIGHO2_01_FULL_45_11]OGV94463.1 MAG: AAA family ATPase [Microgenomates group bacterium RIFCSPLOWO2_01_FULL_46_13]
MQPLADKIRPKTLDEFVGQEHLVGKGKPIRRSVETGQIHSMIFWGPPGSGKTTLARIIANEIEAQFFNLSAVSAGKADVRKVMEQAKGLFGQKRTILFLDEIHRFNKAQQDYLLPFVETGTIILIGATTENPSFEVIAPLLSRCQVFVLTEHTIDDLKKIVERGARELKVAVSDEGVDFLVNFANGDARQTLNLLEATTSLYANGKRRGLTVEDFTKALQSKYLRYDLLGEEHYNTISAFIKSMRASNPDAALYYLARMVAAGEDPLFIARRMVVFASEDIGMVQPTALVVANEVFRACETIGYPECQENLAHGVVYLALAKKDRSAYDAYFRALDDVKKYGNLPIPLNLRNAPTKLMKQLGYGKGYEKYSQENLLPEKLKGKKYYNNKKEVE